MTAFRVKPVTRLDSTSPGSSNRMSDNGSLKPTIRQHNGCRRCVAYNPLNRTFP